uniref:Uncharacterized protein n=1 Tax=Avena sativa TaxID=4498 RepID=A0ACD5WVD8_AVESA
MVTFTACRSKAELVVPARTTPREVKSLSDLDNQPGLRKYVSIIEFFRCRRVPGGDPATSLKAALAEALVHYYPIAGRLRELPGGKKLAVDCTAEGVVFVEAHADVRLEEFGEPLVPPYPCVDQFICDVGDVTAVIGMPLLYLQMTRLRCGGVILVLSMCHSIIDAFGMVQVLRCILDLARGQPLPAILPSWDRHLLTSPVAEAAAFDSSEPTAVAIPPAPLSLDELVTRSFLFGPRAIAALRSGIPTRLGRSATAFELVTAAVWRCRAAALEQGPGERVCVKFTANARGRWKRDRSLPPGFYGNALFITMAEATAGELSLTRAVELVREAKLRVMTDEHVRSVLDMMARGHREFRGTDLDQLDSTFMVSDITRCGDETLDLGWAERVGGGVPMAGEIMDRVISFYMTSKDANGVDCVVVPMCLPEPAMGRFASLISAATNVVARSSM